MAQTRPRGRRCTAVDGELNDDCGPASLNADYGFLTTVEPPVTAVALAALPAVAVPGDSEVAEACWTASSPDTVSSPTDETVDTIGVVFAGL